MKIEWIFLAEGFGTAANGVVTAIGVNQNLIVAPALPITTKRAVLAHLVAEEGTLANAELGVSAKVLGPTGQVIAAQTAPATIGSPLWPDLPITFDLFAEFPLRLADYGTYVVEVEVTRPDGSTAKGHANFYVTKPVPESAS
jgi:hypothetical protein